MRSFLPEEAYKVVADEIAWIQKQPPLGLLSFGLAVSLWLSSSFFGTLIDALNRIQGVRRDPFLLSAGLTAIGLTVIEVVILLGTLIVLVVWPEFRRVFGPSEPPSGGETVARGWSSPPACF